MVNSTTMIGNSTYTIVVELITIVVKLTTMYCSRVDYNCNTGCPKKTQKLLKSPIVNI